MGITVSTSSIVLSSLSYVQVQVVAEVTMPDVLTVDIIQAQDTITQKTVSKATSDTQSVADAAVRTAGKTLSDSQATTDTVSRKSFVKARADTVSPIEALARSITKAPFVDSSAAVDAPSLEPIKSFVDEQGTADLILGFVFQKGLADTILMSDHAEAYRAYLRDYSDAFSLPDAVLKSFVPPSKEESASVSDTSTLGLEKPQSDTLVLIDDMDGDIEYTVIKLISELIFSEDSKGVDFTKNSTDNVTSTDAGTLSMQDYCDLSYFAQDYVGLARTF